MLGGNVNPQQQMLMAVIRSQSLRQRVKELEGNRTPPADLAKALSKGLSIDRRQEDNALVVSVSSRDPEVAARLANHFPAAINDVMRRMASQAAQRKQLFLEEQVRQAREQLAASEERVLQFQQSRNINEPQEQANRTVEAAVALQERISRQELEVARISRTATPDNPQLRSAVSQLELLRGQLARLNSGRGSPVYVPLRQGPELRVASTRLARQFKEYEQVYTGLTAALAQARIDANNNLPVVTVMDPAMVPVSPARSTKKMLILATILGLMGGSALALALGFLGHANRAAPAPAGGRLGGAVVHS